MPAGIKDKISAALQFHQSGQLPEAEELYLQILDALPDNAQTLNLLGLLKLQNKQFEDAVFYIKKATDINPCAYFFESLGLAYFNDGNFDSAIDSYQKSLELDSGNFDVWFNLAMAYKRNGKFDDAVGTYQRALAIKPDNPDVYFNLGNIYENKNETSTALEYYRKASEFGVNDENLNYFLAVSYLKTKNFKDGWKYYEDRPSKDFGILTQELQYKDLIKSRPLWTGEPIKDKTLFVYYEAGLGDTLMYARYIKLLKNKCAKVLFKPQMGFVKLFRDSDLDTEIVGVETPMENVVFDVHIPLMSIPYVLGLNSEEEIPFSGGYLKSNPEKVNFYKEKYFDNNKFKIGIKWQGNAAYDRNRIIPLEKFYRLFDSDKAQFYSIQKGDGAGELKNLPEKYEITDLGTTFDDFADTAAAIENLDLVICNDTSVVHLVGALGKPCWVLLPFVSNWRWHDDFSYSPWYDSVRLFKQQKLDDWDGVFESVDAELKKTITK
ncbi:MAG: tetratricopeptide repeat protein [Candidatus Gastranaerophilaceae bacterium]